MSPFSRTKSPLPHSRRAPVQSNWLALVRVWRGIAERAAARAAARARPRRWAWRPAFGVSRAVSRALVHDPLVEWLRVGGLALPDGAVLRIVAAAAAVPSKTSRPACVVAKDLVPPLTLAPAAFAALAALVARAAKREGLVFLERTVPTEEEEAVAHGVAATTSRARQRRGARLDDLARASHAIFVRATRDALARTLGRATVRHAAAALFTPPPTPPQAAAAPPTQGE